MNPTNGAPLTALPPINQTSRAALPAQHGLWLFPVSRYVAGIFARCHGVRDGAVSVCGGCGGVHRLQRRNMRRFRRGSVFMRLPPFTAFLGGLGFSCSGGPAARAVPQNLRGAVYQATCGQVYCKVSVSVCVSLSLSLSFSVSRHLSANGVELLWGVTPALSFPVSYPRDWFAGFRSWTRAVLGASG